MKKLLCATMCSLILLCGSGALAESRQYQTSFGIALLAVQRGETMTRSAWTKGAYMSIVGLPNGTQCVARFYPEQGLQWCWTPAPEDLAARDWVLERD